MDPQNEWPFAVPPQAPVNIATVAVSAALLLRLVREAPFPGDVSEQVCKLKQDILAALQPPASPVPPADET